MAPVTFLLNGFHQLHQQWRCNLWRAELLLKVRERRPWGEREEVRPHSADSSQQSWGQSTDNNIAPNSSIRRQTEPGPQTLLPGHSHTNAMQRLQGALVPKPARNLRSPALLSVPESTVGFAHTEGSVLLSDDTTEQSSPP